MFDFVRKLFKALNSSGKTWQLSLAIVLAMFSGFLPGDSLLLIDIVFLALILNINFGLFLLFSVIFSGLAYLFDPLFESLGYIVLTNEDLKGLFTAMYNSAVFRWSSFNYTLVTGSLIVSALLAVPLFFLLNKLIVLYRVQIGEKLNEWKLTRWMKLFNEEAKSTSVFRWWGLGVFGGLAAVLIAFFVLFFDPIARIALEKLLSYSMKTQVDIRSFDSSLNDLKVEISGIEVADKKKLSHNLFQIETIRFDLGLAALMEKKAMIEQLQVNALAFDTLREKEARPYAALEAEDSIEKGEEEGTGDKAGKDPFVLPDVNDILAKEELKSVKEAQELKSEIKATQDKWTKISTELKEADDVSQIKADAQRLEASLKGGDIKKIASAKGEIEALKSKIATLKTKYTSLQKEFSSDQRQLQQKIAALKELPQKDINRLKNKYSLNASGGANLIGTLVNEKVGSYMHTVIKYYTLIKPYLKDDGSAEAEAVKPPRGEGRWIKYANLSSYPALLVKEAKLIVILKDDELNVLIKDLSSNQKLYGKPMTIHADAKGTAYSSILANAVDDRRGEKVKTDIELKISGFKQDAYSVETFEMKDILSDVDLKAKIIDKTITGKSDINVRKAKLHMPSQKLVNGLLQGISHFNVAIAVKGAIEEPSISVSSDLDKQLSKGLGSMASKAAQKFEKELTAGVLKKAAGSTEGISSDLGDISSVLKAKNDALSGINLDFSSPSNLLKKVFPF